MEQQKLIVSKEKNIITLTLNRPEVHNAFDDELINTFISILKEIEIDSTIRLVILSANGKSFSAGADLNWMQRMADYSEADNIKDSEQLAELMWRLNNLNKPTIALIQGATFGGGVGLVACCDIAIASQRASFCLSEVKLGLIPAVISPYVINAIGEKASRRYFLTAERFSAQEALNLGLISSVVEEHGLETEKKYFSELLLANGPKALNEAKKLIRDLNCNAVTDAVREETAKSIAKLRVSPEGQEGLKAFLEKRKPNWV